MSTSVPRSAGRIAVRRQGGEAVPRGLGAEAREIGARAAGVARMLPGQPGRRAPTRRVERARHRGDARRPRRPAGQHSRPGRGGAGARRATRPVAHQTAGEHAAHGRGRARRRAPAGRRALPPSSRQAAATSSPSSTGLNGRRNAVSAPRSASFSAAIAVSEAGRRSPRAGRAGGGGDEQEHDRRQLERQPEASAAPGRRWPAASSRQSSASAAAAARGEGQRSAHRRRAAGRRRRRPAAPAPPRSARADRVGVEPAVEREGGGLAGHEVER